MSQTFTQDFNSDAGFTYDSSKAEFVGGILRQKDQRATNSTCGATFSNDVNLNWGNGTLTGTPYNGASVDSGKLDLTGGAQKYVRYSAVGNANSQQVGAIKIRYTPNYNGSPASDQFPFSMSANTDNDSNSLTIFHSSTGQITVRICDSLGNYIVANVALGLWSAVSGTEYEFELNYDLTTGATRFFINGVQFGTTITSTGTRTSDINYITLGNLQTVSTRIPNHKLNDFEVFSTVQHT